MISYSCTAHKVQGSISDCVVISFDLKEQRKFNPGQMNVALSRAKTIEGLSFTGQYNCNAFTECNRFREKGNQAIDVSLNVCLLNIRSLGRHAVDI